MRPEEPVPPDAGPGVPRLAELVLRLAIRDRDVCDGLLSDLEEEFSTALRFSASARRARWWYWRAILGLAVGFLVATGWRKPAARRKRTLVEFVNGRGMMFEAVSRDARTAVRKLWRRPGFTGVTVLILGLGIGGTTALFSMVYAVLLRPLPFDEPDRLVGAWLTSPGFGMEWLPQSPAIYFTFRDESRTLEDIALWDKNDVTLTGLGDAERVPAMMVTDGIFDVLRIQPALGRRFTAADDTPGTSLTVMLGHGFWQRRFGSDPSMIGRTISIDGSSREVIGIMPPGLRILQFQSDVYYPARFDRSEIGVGDFSYQAIARLLPGVTLKEALEDMDRMLPLVPERFTDGMSVEQLRSAGVAPRLRLLKDELVGDVSAPLWILLGAVGMVLLVACANVANLLMVRAEGRRREVAVRTAIGASRGQIVRQHLLESSALGLLGGALGLILADAGLGLLHGTVPPEFPRLSEIRIDGAVLVFTCGISILASLLFGTIPAVRMADGAVTQALKEGGHGTGTPRKRAQARGALVVSQVALAMVLLVGSGLMVRSFRALRSVDPGFANPEQVLTFRVNLSPAEAETTAEVATFHESVIRDLAELPGVVAVSGSSSLPMDGSDSNQGLELEDFPTGPEEISPTARVKWVAGDYFETLQIPVLLGRGLTWDDTRDRARVVVVNQAYAREHWGEPDRALGRRVRQGSDNDWHEIVGIVADVYDDGLAARPISIVYWPLAVDGFWGGRPWVPRWFAYAVRTERPQLSSLLPEARAIIRQANPSIPLFEVWTMEQILDRSMMQTKLTLTLLGGATLAAILLAVVGIYGVIAYSVSQRTREIGVRMALGAAARDVQSLVLRNGLALVMGGVAVGMAASLVLTRLMATLLFGVEPVDLVTYGLAAVGIVMVAAFATYLPARRASLVAPVEALSAD